MTKKQLEPFQSLIFQQKQVRRAWYEKQWWFSVADIVEILSETSNVRDYVKKMRKRDQELSGNWGTICPLVEMVGKDGRKRKISASNLEGIFRIIQSIPSKKAEPFKLWLAKVGYEHMEEMEDPELAFDRAMQTYFKKGYSRSRIKEIGSSNELSWL